MMYIVTYFFCFLEKMLLYYIVYNNLLDYVITGIYKKIK